MHEAAVRAVAALMRDGEPLVITPQIVAELWNVATRPVDQNGQLTSNEIARIEEFPFRADRVGDVYSEWKRLVVANGVRGVQAMRVWWP